MGLTDLKNWLKLNLTKEGRRIKKEVREDLRTAEEDAQKGQYPGAISTAKACINKLGSIGVGKGEKLYETARGRVDYYTEQRQKSREK